MVTRALVFSLVSALALPIGFAGQGTSACEPEWQPTFGTFQGYGSQAYGSLRSLAVYDAPSGTGPALYVGGFYSLFEWWDGTTWSSRNDVDRVYELKVFDEGRGSGPVLFVAGGFNDAGGVPGTNLIAKWDGSAWEPVGNGLTSGFLESVYALAVFDHGSGPALFVGGSFSGAPGVPGTAGIAKWDGTSWSQVGSNGTGVNGLVRALTVFDDGSGPALFAAGSFTNVDGIQATNVARWNGTSWSPLGSNVNPGGVITTLAVFDDGGGPALHAGGTFTSAGGVAMNRVAKWDGSSWSALGSGVDKTVERLTTYDDGNGPVLFVAGTFTSAGGIAANHVAKWDGSAWSDLDGGVQGASGTNVRAFAVFDPGSGAGTALYAAGDFDLAGGAPAWNVARWDGTAWSALANAQAIDGPVMALRAHDDGGGKALYAGGSFTNVGSLTGDPIAASSIARWDGSGWTTLGSAPNGVDGDVRTLLPYDEGLGGGAALFVGGQFASAGGIPASNVARWDGASWTALGSGLSAGWVSALAEFDDGGGPALYAGGEFTFAGGTAVNGIAKWDGSSWSGLGSGAAGGGVAALAVWDDGGGPALYAGGTFSMIGGTPAPGRIAKWDGTAWTPLPGGPKTLFFPPPHVDALAVFDEGSGPRLFVAGYFDFAGEGPAASIARWDGALWWPLGGGLNGTVRALQVFDDHTGAGPALFVSGDFRNAGGLMAEHVARWDGASWSSLGTGMIASLPSNGTPRAFAMQAFDDGLGGGEALFVGGDFTVSTGGDSFLAKRACPTGATGFCTAKAVLVCGPASISASGTPSATAASGFVVDARPVRGCRAGLLLYSNQPVQAGVTFGGVGDGLLCLAPAGLRRAGPIESGGTSPQACDGVLAIDLNAFRASNWTAAGCNPPAGQTNPAGFLANMGTTVHAQMWGRDSIDTGQVVSDGLSWAVGP